jgi:hypothetical protein
MLWSQLTYPTGIEFPINDEFAAVSGRLDAMAVFDCGFSELSFV